MRFCGDCRTNCDRALLSLSSGVVKALTAVYGPSLQVIVRHTGTFSDSSCRLPSKKLLISGPRAHKVPSGVCFRFKESLESLGVQKPASFVHAQRALFTMPLPLLPCAEHLLLDLLSPASIASLRLTSKQLQQQIQQSTVSLRLHRKAIPLLLKRRWSSLTRLTFVSGTVTEKDMAKLAAAKQTALPALAHFGICNGHLFLKIATQELASGSGAFLTSLSLRNSDLPVDSAKHLQNGNWQHLVSLDLSHCLSRQVRGRLTEKKMQRAADTLAASCCYIAAGNWPHLVALDLSHNNIAAAEMAELAKGNWPALRKLS